MNTKQVLRQGMDLIELGLARHTSKIKEAYVKAEGGLTINMAIVIKPTKDIHVVVVETAITFVESRVKETEKFEVNDLQGELFKAVEKLRPKEGSVTISSGNTSVTLESALE
jgi:hypothetical protein